MTISNVHIYILTFGLCITNVFGQNYPTLFSDNSGLPGNTVFDCAESNTGKLWICTNRGLSCYDGYTFKKIGLQDGLTTEFSWGFLKDSEGRLWLKNRQFPLTYIYNDSIFRVGEGKPDKERYFEFLSEDQKGNVYLSSSAWSNTFIVDKNGKLRTTNVTLYLINSKGKEIWGKPNTDKFHLLKATVIDDILVSVVKKKSDNTLSIEIWDTKQEIPTYLPVNFFDKLEHISKLDNEHALVSGNTGIFKLNVKTKKITPFTPYYNTKYKDVAVVYKDRFGNFWLCDLKNGLWFLQNALPFIQYVTFESNTVVLSSFKSDDNMLILTTNKGTIELGKNEQIPIKTLPLRFDGKHEVSSFSKTVLRAPPKQKLHDKIHIELIAGELFLFRPDNFSAPKEMEFDKWYDVRKSNYRVKTGTYLSKSVGDSVICLATAAGIEILHFRENQVKIIRHTFGYTYGVLIQGSYVFSCGIYGLRKLNLKTHVEEVLSEETTYIHLVAGNGFLYARKEDGTIDQYLLLSKRKVATYTHCKDLQSLQMVNDEIWGIGLNRVVRLSGENLEPNYILGSFEGVINPFKRSITKLKDVYYLICQDGYYKFKTPEYVQNKNIDSQLNFDVSCITVNGEKQANDHIKLSGLNNFISVYLQAVYFPRSAGNVSYQYQINNGDWIETEQPIINIASLPYGNHKVKVKAFFKNRKSLTENVKVLYFDNPAPFYKTPAFFILLFFGLLLLVILAMIEIRKRKIKAVELRFKASQNRMKMLIMQMKPHFLSNIFNSLQLSFFENNIVASSNLIKNLDEFLRMSLENSQKDIVTFSEEMTLITKYITLEKLRTDKPIHCKVTELMQEKGKSINLPVFTLQPIIENAIWHGIVPSNCETGEISIDYSEESNYHVISISDNGVGLRNEKSTGNSIALKNIAERLSLIDGNARAEYVQLTNNSPIGTKIKLYVTKDSTNYSH